MIEMDMTFCVRLNGSTQEQRACISIPDMYKKLFEAVGESDERIMAILAGDFDCRSREIRDIEVLRQRVADILAREMASFLVKQMSKNDTKNGYRKHAD